jgi:hypothetical protein
MMSPRVYLLTFLTTHGSFNMPAASEMFCDTEPKTPSPLGVTGSALATPVTVGAVWFKPLVAAWLVYVTGGLAWLAYAQGPWLAICRSIA